MKKIKDIEKLIANVDVNIRAVLQILDKAGTKIIFVVDHEQKLIGSLSDGDIRRFLLAGGKVEENVLLATNKNCLFLQDDRKAVVEDYFSRYMISCVPIVDKDKKIISICFSNEFNIIDKKNQINLPVVIQAGGLGTRLYPYTYVLPKPLIPIGEKPITEIIMDSFIEYGCTEFYIIVNHKKSMIKAYFADITKKYNITFIDEDIPLGTAGGLSLLKGKINKPFFFTNCDVLIDANYFDIYKSFKEKGNKATIVSAIKHIQIPYGVLELDTNGNIDSMIEKPQIDYITNTGLYLLDNKIIDELLPNVSISMPEVLNQNMINGDTVGAYLITEGCWSDMGQLEELEKMRKKLGVE